MKKLIYSWALCVFAGAASAVEPFIVLQSTTSAQDSGLLDAILPGFEAETGIDVRVFAVGTGQAIRNAIKGDADVLLLNAKDAEAKFVADGWGVERKDVMYNDFVLVGPTADPAGIGGEADIIAALQAIAAAEVVFASRGDDSGTHKAEQRLWEATGLDLSNVARWYRETGLGMGATLKIAAGVGAYTLTDRATWIAFGNKEGLRILVEGDARLVNQYGVILVNSKMSPKTRAGAGQLFVDWLTGTDAQAAIAGYRIDGQELFVANAGQ
jgi:tungstate transport system substrate-binding protein